MTLTEFKDKYNCGPSFIYYIENNFDNLVLKSRIMTLREDSIEHNQNIIRNMMNHPDFEKFAGEIANDILLIVDNPVLLPIGVTLKPNIPSITTLSKEYKEDNIEWL